MGNRVVVVGGGASGLMAAVTSAGNGAETTIIEHKDRVGKKLLMTGNGRCNLTNMGDAHGRYYSSDACSMERIYQTLDRFDAAKARDFFRGIGLYTKEKRDGCVYPMSEQASIVQDVLRNACERLGVRTLTGCEAVDITPGRNGGELYFLPQGQREDVISYDHLILAAGGRAAPVSGSDGSGYRLAAKLGHSIIEPLPALVQLRCAGGFFKSVAGVRAQSRLALYIDGQFAAAEEGELQLTDYGISGIPVFQFSRLASRGIHDGRECEVRINFIPFLPGVEQEMQHTAAARHQDKTVEELLSGMVHKKLASLACKQQGIAPGMTVGQAGIRKVCGCLRLLADFRVTVTGANSFENAQVCCGGVPLGEVDADFKSRICDRVYLVGELLDCDGMCGGYNLQWAWATGAIAGAASSRADIAKTVLRK